MITPPSRLIPDRPLTAEAVRTGLKTHRFGRTLHVFDRVDSTNSAALALAEQDAPEGTVVLADSQTQGRGRMGRQWLSPPKRNLYLSIVLRPDGDPRHAGLWSLAAAVAVARTIEQTTGLPARLKWPNDVLIRSKKVAGLLLESALLKDRCKHLVLGIGINVNLSRGDLPDELKSTVTSLRDELGRDQNRIVLLQRLLEQLEHQDGLLRTETPEKIVGNYSDLSETLGQSVSIQDSHQAWFGKAVGFTEEGALIVQPPGGRPQKTFNSGDVVHVRGHDAARD